MSDTQLGLLIGFAGRLTDCWMPRFETESLRYALLLASFVSISAAVHYHIAGKYLAEDPAAQARVTALASPLRAQTQ